MIKTKRSQEANKKADRNRHNKRQRGDKTIIYTQTEWSGNWKEEGDEEGDEAENNPDNQDKRREAN